MQKIRISSAKNFFIFIFFSLIIFLFFVSCNKMDLKIQNYSLKNNFLPIFVEPQIDYKHKNDILGVSIFFKEDGENSKLIEYTILFKDEDYPNFFINFIYDIFRLFKYKRIIDTETFFIYYVKTPDNIWKPEYINFPDDYSSKQTFFEKKVKHFSIKIEGNVFEKKNHRIVIYINTWNHMFSNKDNNPNLRKLIIENYKIFYGNRDDMEKIFRK